MKKRRFVTKRENPFAALESQPGAVVRRVKLPRGSGGEEMLLRLWRTLGPSRDLPVPEREYQFAGTINRRFRFDFAWPNHKLAVEVEGGQSVAGGGHHQRNDGYRRDAEKYNAAQVLGWTVLRYTSDDLRERPVQAIEQIAATLRNRLGSSHGG